MVNNGKEHISESNITRFEFQFSYLLASLFVKWRKQQYKFQVATEKLNMVLHGKCYFLYSSKAEFQK